MIEEDDEDICYWYFLFKEQKRSKLGPKSFCEKFNIPLAKFWNESKVYTKPSKCAVKEREYSQLYKQFTESGYTMKRFCDDNKIPMSTFDLWKRHFMVQEHVNQLRNDDKLIKPKSLKYAE